MSSSSPLLSTLLVLGLFGAPLGCSGESEPAAETKPNVELTQLPTPSLSPPALSPSILSGPQAKKGGYAEAKITCCTNARANRVLDRALELHLALVFEEDVPKAMDALAAAARDAEKEGALEPESLAAVVAIAQAAEGAQGGDLVQQRQAMLQIGRALERLISAHRGGARDLAKAKDPATGDIWFQREGKPTNPFGGTEAEFTR